ncbi:hypothetical protein ACFYPG_32935 [Micromonospora sp. NPDC005553]|uniref:hypothetical protein n=1 Tax=unclassified Micromonospora TaxID=2617518 RepID=UPI0033BB3F30
MESRFAKERSRDRAVPAALVTRFGRLLLTLVAAVGLVLTAACGGGSGTPPAAGRSGPPAGGYTIDPFADGLQPVFDMDPELADQVGRVLIGSTPDIDGLKVVPQQSPYADGVLSSVCGMRRGNGVYGTAFGQQREWEAPDLRVMQLAGAWGVTSGAQAVEQVRGKLGCGTYRDREDRYRVLGETQLPRLPGLDGQLMYCEVIDGADRSVPTHICTLLLARGALVSRIRTLALDTATAERVTKQFSVLAAQSLTAIS